MKENKRICGIYKITNKINEKVYIGQSVDIYSRWNAHLYYAKDETKTNAIYRAIRKYGEDNFSFEIITECETVELNELERYYIETYRSYVGYCDSNGYNLTLGGDSSYGYVHTEESKQKMSKTLKENGNNKLGKNSRAKEVYFDGETYSCATDLAKHLNMNPEQLRNYLNGNNRTPHALFDKGLYYVGQENLPIRCLESPPHAKRCTIDSIIFNSSAECARYLDLPSDCLVDYLNKTRPMPKFLYDRGLRRLGQNQADYTYTEAYRLVDQYGRMLFLDYETLTNKKLIKAVYDLHNNHGVNMYVMFITDDFKIENDIQMIRETVCNININLIPILKECDRNNFINMNCKNSTYISINYGRLKDGNATNKIYYNRNNIKLEKTKQVVKSLEFLNVKDFQYLYRTLRINLDNSKKFINNLELLDEREIV